MGNISLLARKEAALRPLRIRARRPGTPRQPSMPRLRGLTKSRSPRSIAAEDGLTLIEVVVSALLVGLVAIATLTGFNSVNRTTFDERLHDQAAVLAAESQEQLRSDPAETLNQIQLTPHIYSQSVNGQTFTVTQSDAWVNESSKAVGCSATSKETNSGRYLQITSSVTWSRLAAAKRPAVTQTSFITPPDGSGLEVDVTNGGTPLQAVPGVTAIANGVELTTGESGCVIFGAIPSTTASVEVKKIRDVTESGAWRKLTEELPIVPNLTTHYPVTLAPAGSITAHFTYQGKETYEGKEVTGDTFVASNNNIKETPNYELGSTKFEWATSGEKTGAFRALAGNYAAKASTFKLEAYYPNGDLFPFSSAWNVYAGDCPANDPAKFGSTGASALVKSATETTVTIPMSYVKLETFKGAKGSTEVETTSRAVKITNLGCSSYSPPNNSESTLVTERTQNTNSSGALPVPYQPFGKFKLCLLYSSGFTKRIYWTEYTNEGAALTSIKLYLKETGKYENSPTEVIHVESASSC